VRNYANHKIVSLLIVVAVFIAQSSEAATTHIFGYWPNGPKAVVIGYWPNSSAASSVLVKASIDAQNSLFEFHIELKYPTILQFENQFFFAVPGDSVKFNVVDDNQGAVRLEFNDQHGLGHAFLSRMRSEFRQVQFKNYSFDSELSLTRYQKAIKQRYDSTVAFHKEYFKSTNDVFASLAEDFLTAKYYDNLLYPIVIGKTSSKDLPPGYISEFDPAFFEKTSLMGIREYIVLLSNYNRYLKLPHGSNSNGYDSSTIRIIVNSILSNFKGQPRDQLLLFTFIGVAEYGTEKNKAQLDLMYSHLTAAFNQDVSVIDLLEEYKKVGSTLPEEILSQKLKGINGTNITLRDLLTQNHVIYIDMWASWCGPCIAEMEFEKQLMTELKGARVKFVLISIDENEQKWKSSVAKINIGGEHYLVHEGFQSALIKYFSFREIPRYIILDPNGQLVSRNAPRPGILLKDKSMLTNLLK